METSGRYRSFRLSHSVPWLGLRLVPVAGRAAVLAPIPSAFSARLRRLDSAAAAQMAAPAAVAAGSVFIVRRASTRRCLICPNISRVGSVSPVRSLPMGPVSAFYSVRSLGKNVWEPYLLSVDFVRIVQAHLTAHGYTRCDRQSIASLAWEF